MTTSNITGNILHYAPYTSARMEEISGTVLNLSIEDSIKIVLSYGCMCLEFSGPLVECIELRDAIKERSKDTMLISDPEPADSTKAWSKLANDLFGVPEVERKGRVLVSASVYWFYANSDIHPFFEKAIRKEFPRCYPTTLATQTTAAPLYGD